MKNRLAPLHLPILLLFGFSVYWLFQPEQGAFHFNTSYSLSCLLLGLFIAVADFLIQYKYQEKPKSIYLVEYLLILLGIFFYVTI